MPKDIATNYVVNITNYVEIISNQIEIITIMCF